MPADRTGIVKAVLAASRGIAPALIAGIALTVSGGSTYWDIASHVDGGRERFLTPPHIGIYSGVTIALGVIALAILADRLQTGASLFEALRHPFRDVRPGLAAAGTGMATALAAAPFDNAWHEIYGIDITIWSPPHLLAIFGVSVAALGLAMLVAPATGDRFRPALHDFLLSAFLAGLMVTTGEFEFNGPQYRIAYHPMILSAAATLVFVAAAQGPTRWAATSVALWFEGARIASLLVLVALDHSLPFVPVVLPSALLVDYLMQRGIKTPWPLGLASGLVTAATNWLVLQALPSLKWQGDDLVFGLLGAAVAGSVAAVLGTWLGAALAGRTRTSPFRPGRRVAVVGLIALGLAPLPAVAHEVGGDAGRGVISWIPAEVPVDQEVTVSIEDLETTSGAGIDDIRVEAWRAEHRIEVALKATGTDAFTGEFTLPEEGPWMLLIWVEAGDDSLLSTQQLDVSADAGPSSKVHRERFTLGLDTLAQSSPPLWLDGLAYAVAIVTFALLLRGLLRSLRRLATDGEVVTSSR
jgi:hypothetical protein